MKFHFAHIRKTAAIFVLLLCLALSIQNSVYASGIRATSSGASAAEDAIAQTKKDLSTSRQRTAKRWETTYKVDDFVKLGLIPANTNFTAGGEITKLTRNQDGTQTVEMFSTVTTTLPSKAKADIPVFITFRMSRSESERLNLRVNSRKTFTTDGNYVIAYQTQDGIIIRAMDNSLTPEPDTKNSKK